jgi:hypothetical protein
MKIANTLRITAFMDFVHRSKFQITRKHVSKAGSVSVFWQRERNGYPIGSIIKS